MNSKDTVGTWMKRNVVSINAKATLRDAAALLSEKRVGTLPVLDDSERLIGVTTIDDILKLFLPDFLSLIDDVDFVKDYGALRELSLGDIKRADSLTVGDILNEAVSIEIDCSLVRALAVMKDHSLSDLPVLLDNKLVGVVSKVDIGRAFLEHYLDHQPA